MTEPDRTDCSHGISRRRFMTRSARCASAGIAAGCASYIAAMTPLVPGRARRLWAQSAGGGAGRDGRTVAQTPFARIEQVGEGMYAIISTPMDGDFTTVCNGGIAAGPSRTVVVESFATPDGARWAAEQARALTGRWPDQVVVSHHHGDHSAGVTGFDEDADAAQQPALRATATMRDLVRGSAGRDEATMARWADAVVLPADEPVEIDLGDRVLTVTPRRGHTDSDVTVEVDGGEGPVWCGDLVWNAMFPNYMDATPSRLSRAVRAIGALPATTFVPGHGPLTDSGAFSRYIALIDSVEEAARDAWRSGLKADEAAAAYAVPEELGEWISFNPSFHLRAFQSWLGELGGAQQQPGGTAGA